jgi:hypothetical protein
MIITSNENKRWKSINEHKVGKDCAFIRYKGNKFHEVNRIISHWKKSVLQEDFRIYFHYLGCDISFEYDEHINNEINKWIPTHSEVKHEQKHKFNLQKTEGQGEMKAWNIVLKWGY